MQKHAHVKPIRQWLQSLAILTTVTMNRDDAETRFAAYVAMLADRFPDEAFTRASLEHVAAKATRGFPTYGELVEALTEWWKDNRPHPVAIRAPPPAPREPPPTLDQIAQMRAAASAAIAALRADAEPTPDTRPSPRHLSPAQLDALNPLPNGYSRVSRAVVKPAPTQQADARKAQAERDQPAKPACTPG
jgi:hypothetical protein